ncbi:efflux RND transporter periplasmic adaptor subunit [Methylolobus aquaticus]|nr:efflux RND transporter periplasmic adaptor subunit [Methylolobus aquaticus]
MIFARLVLALTLVATGVRADDLVRLSDEQIEHLAIRTIVPERVSSLPLAWAPGRIVVPPQNEFLVSAPQAGLVSKVHVALGASVRAGQVLAEMQSPSLLAQQRDLLNAATEFQLAERQLQRDQTLLSEGIISRIRWQETKSRFDKAQTQLREAEQVLTLSGLPADELKQLEATRRLSDTLKLRSPVDGVLLERMAVAGQRVDILTPLFRVANLDELWLEISVPQERANEIRIGDRVTLDKPKLSGRITQVSRNINPNSQSVLVRSVIEKRASGVLAGQNVNVLISHASTDYIVRLPTAALVNQEGRQYMFVRAPGGFAVRPVAVAGVEARDVVVHEGLKKGDEVVVQGVAALKAAWLGMGPGG